MDDLICSYYTLAGVSPTEGGASSRYFESRMKAAADAGYRGVGIHVRDYRALRASGYDDLRIAAVLKAHGLEHIEIEFLLNWFADGDAGVASRIDEDLLYHMSEMFEARVLFLGGDMAPDNPMPFEELASRFSGLCERAAARGVTIGVEPCAWTNVGTLDDALALIDASGATNAGLFLDLWHLHRRKLDLGRIASLRPGQIKGVQLDDAASIPAEDIVEDCLDFRELPGEGVANAPAFVAELIRIGFESPISVEVISRAQRGRETREAARVSFQAAREVIHRAKQLVAAGSN